MSHCRQIDRQIFEITVAPESDPINDSAWYAFQVQSEQPSEIEVRLCYRGGSHRYDPKISRDGIHWQSGGQVVPTTYRSDREIRFRVQVDQQPLWIAGQELLSTDEVDQWTENLASRDHVVRQTIGQSVEGRRIDQLTITESESPDTIFIVARQHPPEVSGAIGMMHFVDAIADDNELAHRFRKRFATMVVPTMNPDGVHHGNWRCNANGVDLNRDWHHFTQPETRAVRDELLKCRRDDDGKLCLFVDFHSTYEDVFFMPPAEEVVFPPRFSTRWFDAIARRFPDYEVNVDDEHNAHRNTSKAWVHHTLATSAVTYEFGDETDRDTIRTIATGAAEEMMRLLLDLREKSEPATQITQKKAGAVTR